MFVKQSESNMHKVKMAPELLNRDSMDANNTKFMGKYHLQFVLFVFVYRKALIVCKIQKILCLIWCAGLMRFENMFKIFSI